MTLPNKLIDVFSLDEGMRPGIYFEGLDSDEVIEIYRYLLLHSKAPGPEFTVWSNKLELDLPISTLANPAELVVKGEICPLCHPLIEFSNSDIYVNNVSIYVFQDSLELFYDVRDMSTVSEVENVLKLVKRLASMSSRCIPFFGGEVGDKREECYQTALRLYLNA